MKTLQSTILFILCAISIHSQSYDQLQKSLKGRTYGEIKTAMNAYFADHPDSKYLKHWKRYEWFMDPRLNSDDLPDASYRKSQKAYLQFIRKEESINRNPHGLWNFVGPEFSSSYSYGRCLRIAFHPTDPNIYYVTTSAGGLWRTENDGVTWFNVTPDLPTLFTTDIAIDHTDPNTLYLLTGAGEGGEFGLNFGLGVLKSTDAGETWYSTAYDESVVNGFPHRIVMDPSDPLTLIVATSSGLYTTDDGFATIPSGNLSTFGKNIRDIEFHPNDPNIIYASADTSIFKNDGSFWREVLDPAFAGLDSMYRIELAVSSDFPDLVFCIASDGQKDYVLRSFNAGEDSTWVIANQSDTVIHGQASYNMAIAIDPDNFYNVFIGGIGIHKSSLGGGAGTFTDIGYGAMDHHDLAFNNGNLYNLNDKGLYRSSDLGSTWTGLSPGIHSAEVYAIAGTPQTPDLLYAGHQDTQGNRITPTDYKAVIGWGDIMTCLLNPMDSDMVFMAPQYGGMNYSFDGGNSFTNAGPGADAFEVDYGRGIWQCPYQMNLDNPEEIISGKDSMYRYNIVAKTATYMGNPGPGKTKKIAQSNSNRSKMYITATNLGIYRTDDIYKADSCDWVLLGFPEYGLNLTDVGVHPQKDSNVYVVAGGYEDGKKVYFSDSNGDAGTWYNISYNLPNIAIQCIAFHNNGEPEAKIYIGTDIGIFYKEESWSEWVYFSHGLPVVTVTDMYINANASIIHAATWGRGVWKSPLYDVCVPNIGIYNTYDSGTRYYSAATSIVSDTDYRPTFSTDVHYRAGDFIDLKPGFVVGGEGKFEANIGPCPQIYLDLRSRNKNLMTSRLSQEIVQRLMK